MTNNTPQPPTPPPPFDWRAAYTRVTQAIARLFRILKGDGESPLDDLRAAFAGLKPRRIFSGLASALICLVTHCFSSALSSSLGWYFPSSVTKADIAEPFISSGLPTTAASATLGCDTRADSTSAVPIL